MAIESCRHRALRYRYLAAAHRKCRRLDVVDFLSRFGANGHCSRDTVKDPPRAEVLGDRPNARGPVRPDLHPLGKNARLGRRRRENEQSSEIGRDGEAYPNSAAAAETSMPEKSCRTYVRAD